MEATVWVPLVSGFIGALVGSLGSVAVVLIQSIRDERKHKRETATKLALADWQEHAAVVKAQGGALYPMALYLSYHMGLMEALARNDLTPDLLRQISARMDTLIATMDDIEEKRGRGAS